MTYDVQFANCAQVCERLHKMTHLMTVITDRLAGPPVLTYENRLIESTHLSVYCFTEPIRACMSYAPLRPRSNQPVALASPQQAKPLHHNARLCRPSKIETEASIGSSVMSRAVCTSRMPKADHRNEEPDVGPVENLIASKRAHSDQEEDSAVTDRPVGLDFVSGGLNQSLPYRSQMESAFGRSLGFVRVRTGAVDAMRQLGARAAAYNSEIAFADDHPGKWLVAHELTHVMQHARSGNTKPTKRTASGPNHSAAEVEADQVASRVVTGRPVGLISAQPSHAIQRFAADDRYKFGQPPKKPKTAAKRVEDRIQDMSSNRKPLTFAQIFVAVRDARFKTIPDGDLKRLELTELRALDSLSESRFNFYKKLAEKQAADPGFEPPVGTPDFVFKYAAIEYRNFREDRLARFLAVGERRSMAPSLIDPWAKFIQVRFGEQPIGLAMNTSIVVASKIVEAELLGGGWEFQDPGIARYGYLELNAVQRLLDEPLPPKLTRETAAAHINKRIITTIKEDQSLMPVKLARAFLESGNGSATDTANLEKRAVAIDNDFGLAISLASQQQVGSSFTGYNPSPANLIFSWLSQQAQQKGSICNAYAKFFATTEGVF